MIEDDDYTVDACEDGYKVQYWEYLNDPSTNSEQTMSAVQFVAFYKDTFERKQ